MKNVKPFTMFAIVLACLAAYALFAAEQAIQRRDSMLFVVLLATVVIFWKRSQKLSK